MTVSSSDRENAQQVAVDREELTDQTISILLVDDHPLVRGTMGRYLNQCKDLKVVGAVGDADAAVVEAVKLAPAIVLMDIEMPGMLCFEAARMIRLRCPSTRVVFLSAYSHDRYIEQALAVRAAGYLTKDETPESLVEAIRSIAAGYSRYSANILSRLVVMPDGVSVAEQSRARSTTLTSREKEILQYLSRGLAKKEIAQLMHISVNTVNRHTDSIMAKLDIHDRVQLARFAICEGLA